MRGVRKSRSPADVGKEGRSQLSLKRAAADLAVLLKACPLTEHVERARFAFDDLEKSKLRQILLEDQHHLCAYCETEVIDDPNEHPPVDHWEPLGKAPGLALSWGNLYLSCSGKDTCDRKKKGERLVWDDADPSLPPPCAFQYERFLGFGRGGDVYVRRTAALSDVQRRALELAIDDREDSGIKRESLLGLNHRDLVAARKAVLDRERSRIERLFPNAHASISAPERRSRAQSLLGPGPRESFVSARVSWLEGRVGKDRP